MVAHARRSLLCAVCWAGLEILAGAAAESEELFERVHVVAQPDTIPGSVTRLDEEHLAHQSYSDVHRVLSAVPGVNVREEEGYGLRPNIGMRGTGVERSAKITLLEDGVLIAPAPYAAPEAYYFPTMGRMEGLEVRKGSSSIQQGPFTTGGVLNLLSSGIPKEFGGRVDLAFGSHDTQRGRLKLGDSQGQLGWLFETYQLDTRGFKELDGGGDTGFDLEDYMGKFRITSAPDAAALQALELKAVKTTQLGDETYLGLTQEDFDLTPFRRYAGSQMDRLDTDHEQLQARYLFQPSETLDLTATLYRTDFSRNWRKLESVSGVGLPQVLADPTAFAGELAILRGDLTADSADDALAVRNNRRDYYAQGIHVVLGLTPEPSGNVAHDIEVGMRYHEDEEDRFQEQDGYRMTTGGQMVRTSTGAPGSQANRVSQAGATALFVQDTLTWGRFALVPGLRYESIGFDRVDYADAARTIVASRGDNRVNEWIPGVGLSYRFNPQSSVFGGVHRGFSPPGPASANASAEESVNYEVGYRHTGDRRRSQIVGFFNDYDNLLGVCTVSSGCSSSQVGDVFDGGEVEVYGLEAGLGFDLAGRPDANTRFPINLAYTYTETAFRSSFQSDFAAWGTVESGDELPDVPEHQAALDAGMTHGDWSAYANLIYVGQTRTAAGQGPVPESESIDAHLITDLSLHYRLRAKLRLMAQVQNVTDEVYTAARRPAGMRPGIGRTALFGISLDF